MSGFQASVNRSDSGADQADISVAFATYRRSDILERTLDAFTSISTDSLRWHLVIVDNADDAASQQVLRRYEKKLPLTWIVEGRAGKNRALNAALPLLRGDILVFTDDDILPDKHWLEELQSASRRWPAHTIFGGRIVPDRTIPFDLSDPFVRSAYVISDAPLSEAEISPGRIWGPNMAIRASAVRASAITFDESIGPAGLDYAMGSETELLLRLAALGNRAVFVPTAVVSHQIRPEQLSLSWLRGRCFRAGRGHARHNPVGGKGVWLGVPRYLLKTALSCWIASLIPAPFRDRNDRVRASLNYSFVLGQIREYFRHSRRQPTGDSGYPRAGSY